jgi:4-hydroxy-tetrahydrodipicolinate synthase
MTHQTWPTLWTALVTPLLDHHKIDWQGLKTIIQKQEDAKNGILLLGSTGEALNMPMPMKQLLLDWVAQTKLHTPWMVGVGGSDLSQTIGWIDTLNQYAIDAYLLVTPPYAKPGVQGQIQWFKALMDRAQKPCMLYNVPSRTACVLHRDALLELRTHPRFMGLKESSGDLKEFRAYKTILPHHPVYCGDDGMMPDFAKAGAHGLVSVASNVWPEATHRYAQMCLSQTLQPQHPWAEASQALFTASNPVPVKHLLMEIGWIAKGLVLPPLSEKDLKQPTALTQAHQAVERWYQKT